MDHKFNKEEILAALDVYKAKAEELLKDDKKMESFLHKLEAKIEKVPVAGSRLADIPVLVSLVRAYTLKQYRELPTGPIVAAVCALIYFVAPVDLIPDQVPVAGFADDAAVLLFAEEMMHDDLKDYKAWQVENNIRC